MVADQAHVLLGLQPELLSESRSQEVERVETMNERDEKKKPSKNYKANVDLLKHEVPICFLCFPAETPQRNYVTALTFPASHTCFYNESCEEWILNWQNLCGFLVRMKFPQGFH